MTKLKRHDSWEAHGWIRTEIGGLYRHESKQVFDAEYHFVYVWLSIDGAENEASIKYELGHFTIVGWTIKSRENKFDSLKEVVEFIQRDERIHRDKDWNWNE